MWKKYVRNSCHVWLQSISRNREHCRWLPKNVEFSKLCLSCWRKNTSQTRTSAKVFPSFTVKRLYCPILATGRLINVVAYSKSMWLRYIFFISQGLHHDLPSDALLAGAEVAMPLVFVGDKALPLQRIMMRPFPWLSSSGVVSQWQPCRRLLGVSPYVDEVTVMATSILHNLQQTPAAQPCALSRRLGCRVKESGEASWRHATSPSDKPITDP